MAAKIATLGEVLSANVTLVGPLHSVLAEVVPQVAALAEHGFAFLELAAEVELGALRLTVVNFYRLVPLLRNTLKMLVLRSFTVDDSGGIFAGIILH